MLPNVRFRAIAGVALAIALGNAGCMPAAAPTRYAWDAATDHARQDLECLGPFKFRETPSGFEVAGCERRVVYAQIYCYGRDAVTCFRGSIAGRAVVAGATYTQRFVPISRPAGDARRYGGQSFSGDDVVRAATPLAELNVKGAADLQCPRDQVVPFFVPGGRHAQDTPVAEGCDRRATYLAAATLTLSSVVDARERTGTDRPDAVFDLLADAPTRALAARRERLRRVGKHAEARIVAVAAESLQPVNGDLRKRMTLEVMPETASPRTFTVMTTLVVPEQALSLLMPGASAPVFYDPEHPDELEIVFSEMGIFR
jgi:hypothetical protein